ncbi:MAG: hypothetical protein OS112_09565 [Methanoregula sp.]|nr:MAG: hypothetical protein OS112_09565 [Methanoregula sp.]
MRKALLLTITACLLCGMMPIVSAIAIEINATPSQVHIGDTVTLKGSVTGIKTIAVYLFVTGPDLDNRGVTLENLNYPAGRGLFTTAPVNLNDGTWEYKWDTSVILGTLKPGTYTVHVVSTPVDRLRFAKGESARTDIEFLPSDIPTNEVPLNPVVTIAALVTVSCASIWLVRRSEKK